MKKTLSLTATLVSCLLIITLLLPGCSLFNKPDNSNQTTSTDTESTTLSQPVITETSTLAGSTQSTAASTQPVTASTAAVNATTKVPATTAKPVTTTVKAIATTTKAAVTKKPTTTKKIVTTKKQATTSTTAAPPLTTVTTTAAPTTTAPKPIVVSWLESNVLNSYDSIAYLSKDCCAFSKGGKYGLLDTAGKVRVDAKYDGFSACRDGFIGISHYYAILGDAKFIVDTGSLNVTATAHENHGNGGDYVYKAATNTVYFQNSAGQLTEYNKGSKSGYTFCRDLTTNRWGVFNSAGKLVLAPIFDDVGEFVNGYAAVCRSGKWGYISSSISAVIPCEYDAVQARESNGWRVYDYPCRAFDGKYVAVKKGDKMGVIDINNNIIVPFEYDVIMQGKNGVYIAQRDGKWGMLGVGVNPTLPR